MMRHAAAIRGVRLGRADIHPAIELARIGVDDFRVEALGERHRDGRFADAGRPHDKADANRARPRGGLRQRGLVVVDGRRAAHDLSLVHRLAAEQPLDLSAAQVNMHRAAMRAVGLELGAVESSSSAEISGGREHAADAHRAMAGELLQQFLERASAACANDRLRPCVDHVGQQPRAAFGAEDRRRALEQQRGGPNGSSSKPIARNSRQRRVDLRGARRIRARSWPASASPACGCRRRATRRAAFQR